MNPDPSAVSWMSTWLEAQRDLMSGLLRSIESSAEPGAIPVELTESYRRLFTPVAAIAGGAASLRCQAAMQKSAELAAAVARDAARRLSAELASPDPALPPVTSLRQLLELWVECGETAWAAAAHREDFADAQAELLASFVEPRSGRPA